MTVRSVAVGVLVSLGILAGFVAGRLSLRRLQPMPRIAFSSDNVDKALALCRDAAIVREPTSESVLDAIKNGYQLPTIASDYKAWIGWNHNRWESMVFRSDESQMYVEPSTDINHIIRTVCRNVSEDSARYFERRARFPDQPREGRFQLHELRNGSVSTSAIIDTATGHVWIWTNYPKGKTGFRSEDIKPEPEP